MSTALKRTIHTRVARGLVIYCTTTTQLPEASTSRHPSIPSNHKQQQRQQQQHANITARTIAHVRAAHEQAV
jgi:hypothetical protein